ncbi:MAG: 3-dehydroquinate synthase II [Nitrososphaerota archaeon]
MNKQIIISPRNLDRRLLEHALSIGIRDLYLKVQHNIPESSRGEFNIYLEKEDGSVKLLGKEDSRIVKVKVESVEDIEKISKAVSLGAEKIFVDTSSWKIIPLENLIAQLQDVGVMLYAYASSLEEVETLLGVLEIGVDGVVVSVNTIEDLDIIYEVIKSADKMELVDGEIIETKNAGMGERVCVDTVAMLEMGEGLLVGNTAQFFFLVHNESVGSAFTSPRPFRVNAGAVHCYVMMPDRSTKYLSELRSGMRVLMVSKNGRTRVASIGRVKIERRPLKLVKAKFNDIEGSVILQNAETIRLVGSGGSLIPVTEIRPGDKVVVHVSGNKARHFGKAVNEFIIER